MKHRISKATLAKLPANVAATIKDIQNRYSDHNGKPYFHSFNYRIAQPGYSHWHGEGEQVTYIYGSNQASAEIAGENNHNGAEIGHGKHCPAGTVIITVAYYSGYYMSIINVGDAQLPA